MIVIKIQEYKNEIDAQCISQLLAVCVCAPVILEKHDFADPVSGMILTQTILICIHIYIYNNTNKH